MGRHTDIVFICLSLSSRLLSMFYVYWLLDLGSTAFSHLLDLACLKAVNRVAWRIEVIEFLRFRPGQSSLNSFI